MDRIGIRRLAAEELGLRTSAYRFASDIETYRRAVKEIGLPVVVKPVMSSSGKGQSIVRSEEEVDRAFYFAQENARGKGNAVIVEEFIDFDFEITLLTVRTKNQGTLFCEPIGHIQVEGDYHESWQPQPMTEVALQRAKEMAKAVTDALGGYGIFGCEFFVKGDDVWFSEVSPRPHDTGMVTMISQNMSEFEVHLRAILGLPMEIKLLSPGASYCFHAKDYGVAPLYDGLVEALSIPDTKVRIFGKPTTRPKRRMGVALAVADTIEDARRRAKEAAMKMKVIE
jgi:phosphoribosylglycinamide formyltransferase 2